MRTPLLSVVVPTQGRPALLPRAVESALRCGAAGEVEVIVVPNGADASWRDALARFAGAPGLRVEAVATAHANVARNHGLAAARGEFVRFLDDDDFLYPAPARAQVDALAAAGDDVSSAAFDAVDRELQRISTLHPPAAADLLEAIFRRHGMWQPTAHVFRRERVAGLHWDENLAWCQDFDWLLQIALIPGLRWQRFEASVGVWHRHLEPRIGLLTGPSGKRRVIAERTLQVTSQLESAGRLTAAQRAAAATSLWNSVHVALFQAPRYWSGIARRARALQPQARPDIALYRHPVLQRWAPDPLLWEWLLLPRRLLGYWTGRLRRAAGLARHG